MGCIINSRVTKEGSVILDVELEYEESLTLKGNIKNVHIFSEDAAEMKTNLSQRGANEATKYFLIPKALRGNLNLRGEVKCQKIDSEDKTIFIFVVENK